MTAPVAPGRVLPTLNQDGSRRWIRPKPSPGRMHSRRRAVAWTLMAIFLALPHLRVGGRPLVLLDLPRREFTLFGTTFLPTDTLLLMLLLASVVVSIFLLTALFGRVWCGWACPQTVYMEFLFRPIERWLEGGRSGSLALDRDGGRHFHPRRIAKYAVYAAIALVLAHTFLAYFVGTAQLSHWVTQHPAEHPTAFFVMAATTALVFFDFAWFREQTCLVACPYGRWQSVLLDRQSIVVSYDAARGEPRARGRAKGADAGDCIDCAACVTTCPTGIDIRDGLQMECIHCTQCMDACDAVMRKVDRPTGLIRYSSRAALEGEPLHALRPRTVLYPLALVLLLGGLGYGLATRADAEVTLLRGIGAPFVMEPDGKATNQIRIKVTNRTTRDHAYSVALHNAGSAVVVAPEIPLLVAAGETRSTSVFVLVPPADLHHGSRDVVFRISDEGRFAVNVPYRLLGPMTAPVAPAPGAP